MNIRNMIIKGIIGFILGVPIITDTWGITWHLYKFAKQEQNCAVDVSNGMKNLDFELGKSADNAILAVQNQFRGCIRNLDVGKGSIQFLLEQHRRGG